MKYQSFKARKMLAHAKELVYTLKELMPTQYQKENLEAKILIEDEFTACIEIEKF